MVHFRAPGSEQATMYQTTWGLPRPCARSSVSLALLYWLGIWPQRCVSSTPACLIWRWRGMDGHESHILYQGRSSMHRTDHRCSRGCMASEAWDDTRDRGKSLWQSCPIHDSIVSRTRQCSRAGKLAIQVGVLSSYIHVSLVQDSSKQPYQKQSHDLCGFFVAPP